MSACPVERASWAPRSPVIFLGLPKGGSTSFHFLMRQFVPSFHVGGPGGLDAMGPSQAGQLCNTFAADYARIKSINAESCAAKVSVLHGSASP